jgi:hypothetical protein
MPVDSVAGSNYAFAKNNKFMKNSTRDDPFKALESPEKQMEDEGNPEGQNFIAFLLTLEDGCPIGFQKEYFGKKSDAENYINDLKEVGQDLDGFVVPFKSEAEAEQKINQMINTGDPNNQEEQGYPKADADREGAYWAENSMVDEYFDALDEFTSDRNRTKKELTLYLLKYYELTQVQANAVASSYVLAYMRE